MPGAGATDEFAELGRLFNHMLERNQALIRAMKESLDNVALHETVQRQAVTDELTGLFNHRRFQELLSDGHDRYLENGIRVGLILLDFEPNYSFELVDNFKFRDNWVGRYSMSGHQTNWFVAASAEPGTPFAWTPLYAKVSGSLPAAAALLGEGMKAAVVSAPSTAGTIVAQIGTLYYFGFFLLMPWWSRLGAFKPVPERITFAAH